MSVLRASGGGKKNYIRESDSGLGLFCFYLILILQEQGGINSSGAIVKLIRRLQRA